MTSPPAVTRAAGIEAVAVCYLHSYANAAHEQRTGEILREMLPDAFISLSVDVVPRKLEYERTSTTVINAYVGPPVKHYVRSMVSQVRGAGIGGRLMVMQSSGGILDAGAVAQIPARIVECGPAAGVVGARHFAARAGFDSVITLDMGGTTAKASLMMKAVKAVTTYRGRDPRDFTLVALAKVTPEHAQHEYGVVLVDSEEPGVRTLDLAATEQLRERMRTVAAD